MKIQLFAPLFSLFFGLFLGPFALSAAASDAPPEKASTAPAHAVQTIAALDVPRYMGTWFEIAKFPNWFQRKCVGGTKAEYSVQQDGMVQVINRCRIASGEMIEAIGAARQIGGATSPRLEVRFAPAWLAFLPFVWGNYWVIDLDEQYQLVAVSEPSKEYLWILARTPTIAPDDYQKLLARLSQQGFDLRKLELSKQD